MYAAPHAFALNPPQIFAEIRRSTYPSGRNPLSRLGLPPLSGLPSVVVSIVISVLVLSAISFELKGGRALLGPHGGSGSPYSVVPYRVIIAFALVPFALSMLSMFSSAKNYWRSIQGSNKVKLTFASVYRTALYAGDLRYLSGGGAGCAYPEEEMSPIRRHLHGATFYGFIALLLSTTSAGIAQDLLGSAPPYPLLSIPVGLGIIGGIAMTIGCIGLTALKVKSNKAPSDAQMVQKDYWFLVALISLGITGLLTLVLRNSAFYGIILVFHLSIVFTTFVIAPYTKFVHFIYRFLSILKDNLERENDR